MTLRKQGAARHPLGHRITAPEVDQAEWRYLAGEAVDTISVSLGRNPETVTRALRARQVVLRKNTDHLRKYVVNDSYFSTLSEESAYWLGFLAADGFVASKKPVVGVSLARKDRGHLVRFRNALDATYPVTDGINSGGHPYSSLRVTSPEMVSDLSHFGIVPRKSLTIQWPDLPRDLERHFIRGYFDGDGNLHRRKDNCLALSFVGTESTLLGIRACLVRECGVRETKVSSIGESGVFSLVYGGNLQVPRITDWLYDGASVWLPRKRLS